MDTGIPSAMPSPDDNDLFLRSLPRYLTIAYLALIVYASLHPFSGWRAPGISPFVFLEATWPRYWTLFDLSVNVLAYVPFGFFLAQSLGHRVSRPRASLIAFVSGVMLSFAIESIQSCLPSRVPSSLDLFCNSFGAGLGALASFCCGRRCLARVFLHARRHLLCLTPYAEYGLILIGLWLLTQLSPETLLFSSGDLRHLFAIPPTFSYGVPSFVVLETAIVACNTLVIGLFVGFVFAGGRAAPRVLARFFAAALLVRTLAAAMLVGPKSALVWLTPGAGAGFLLGGAALFLTRLSFRIRVAVVGAALLVGVVLVNLAPFNPYSVAALAVWRQGHFLNFNGLTRLTASLWPFLALVYLILLGRSDVRRQ
ncbi:MAG: VanZ family protein [Candidatus Accumulibacter sp.]|jgi:glycopeptide antibiotics resistance protein|nr:VanZ family protein [Accumulibacter sp.]